MGTATRHIPLALVGLTLMTQASDCHLEMRLNDPDGFSTLVVVVRTTGTPADSDGYVVSVRRRGKPLVEPARLHHDDSRQFQIERGASGVDVLLEDVASHCRILGTNPRRTSSAAGSPAAVDFEIRCGAGS